MQVSLKSSAVMLVVLIGLVTISTPSQAGIEQLLIGQTPVPTQRPDLITGSIAKPSIIKSDFKATPISGSLKSGLQELSKRDAMKALQIRAGMRSGSLDRKILAWAIALSGRDEVPSSEIVSIARDLPEWPGKRAMMSNAEKAFAREAPHPSIVVQAYSGRKPITIEGAMTLAKAHLALGDKSSARASILPFWKDAKLSEKLEKEILRDLGIVFTLKDHRDRMHQQFYKGRTKSGKRMGAVAKQFSLAKAWDAVLKQSSTAEKLINSVAPESRKNTGYLFVRIENARRKGKYREAANLLLKAPRDVSSLVDPDEWWNERRIVSRQMLELGDARTAYILASQHSATSASKIAEAEFHAGWYALRFLNDAKTARVHFKRLIDVTTQPISQSRGHYWMGRASSGNNATKHYRKAASYSGTYYGQLAAAKLDIKTLNVSRPRPTDSERSTFENRELVRAMNMLKANGYAWRADAIYRHLAKELTSPGELAILSASAERKGKNKLALQIGKLANARGLNVDTLAWPIGAIPASAKPGKAGLALSYAIARQESAFDVGARSSADARGLLQLLPGTAKAMARSKGLKYSSRRLSTDGGYNVTLGAAYLTEQLTEFEGSYILTFAAYNAGPRRAQEWVARFGNPKTKTLNDVIDWVELIPFTETRNYVQRVMENYQVYKARLNNNKLSIVSDLTRGRR